MEHYPLVDSTTFGEFTTPRSPPKKNRGKPLSSYRQRRNRKIALFIFSCGLFVGEIFTSVIFWIIYLSAGTQVSIMGICTFRGEELSITTSTGKEKTMRIITLLDETGEIDVKTWDEHFEINEKDALILDNVNVTAYNNGLEIIVKNSTRILLNEQDNDIDSLKAWYDSKKDGNNNVMNRSIQEGCGEASCSQEKKAELKRQLQTEMNAMEERISTLNDELQWCNNKKLRFEREMEMYKLSH